jgi:hypothetical protein
MAAGRNELRSGASMWPPRAGDRVAEFSADDDRAPSAKAQRENAGEVGKLIEAGKRKPAKKAVR